MRRAKSPLQTVYLDKDLVKPKIPMINSKQEDKEEEGKKTRTFLTYCREVIQYQDRWGEKAWQEGEKGCGCEVGKWGGSQ